MLWAYFGAVTACAWLQALARPEPLDFDFFKVRALQVYDQSFLILFATQTLMSGKRWASPCEVRVQILKNCCLLLEPPAFFLRWSAQAVGSCVATTEIGGQTSFSHRSSHRILQSSFTRDQYVIFILAKSSEHIITDFAGLGWCAVARLGALLQRHLLLPLKLLWWLLCLMPLQRCILSQRCFETSF